MDCPKCGEKMLPVWFTEKEYSKSGFPTGRKRKACSHLECPNCFQKEVVDDSLDGPWK